MGKAMKRLGQRTTFANLTALVALFIALGGTSYAALSLPRNSVGLAQIKARAVGPSELRTQAVSGRSVRNRSLTVSDIAPSSRAALRGQQGVPGPQGVQGPPGPTGVTYFAAVNSGGGTPRGNATGATHQGGTNQYTIFFERSVDPCVATATLASVQNGPVLEEPPPGRITLAHSGKSVIVKTFAADGSPDAQPFNLILAC